MTSSVFADEQTVVVNAEVGDASFFGWLYSENTKQVITGSSVTIITILIGAGVYYLLKVLF